MSKRINNNVIDLSIVCFKDKYYESRFVGIGIPGYQIAERLSKKSLHISDPVLRDSVINITHETGESSKLLTQSLSHLPKYSFVIISGSPSDPNLHLLRNMALSKNLMLLWTILDAPSYAIAPTSSIQPQINESITIIPQGVDYIDKSIVLVQTLIHYIQEAGFVGIELKDVSDLFAGRWTKILNVITNNQSYIEDIQRFRKQNKIHFDHARSAGLILFAGHWLGNSEWDDIDKLFFTTGPNGNSYGLYGVYDEDDFESMLHVAIILDDDLKEIETQKQVQAEYQEKVVTRPAGFFRSEELRMKTRNRQHLTIQEKTLNNPLAVIRDEWISAIDGQPECDWVFCFIPAGSFMMGDEGNQHEVTLTRDFYLSRHPVTQRQWEMVMGKNPSNFRGADKPVEQVSWKDVQQYIKKLNELVGESRYRLPTETQWEYACRAGNKGKYCFGDQETLLGEYAWYHGNSNNETHPVGLKKANAWGLYDMHGNVWEWVQDWRSDYPNGSVTDPQGTTSGSFRVNRGGSWYENAKHCRSTNRGSSGPGGRDFNLGFRLLRTHGAPQSASSWIDKACLACPDVHPTPANKPDEE